jgi:hypothetical protein
MAFLGLDKLFGRMGGGLGQEPDAGAPGGAPQPEAPGSAGLEAGAPDKPDYGEGMSQLPEELKQALLDLLDHYEDMNRVPRRAFVKNALEAHCFSRGEQYIGWNENAGQWGFPSQAGGSTGLSSAGFGDPNSGVSSYVINRYQAYERSFIAIIVGNRPTEKFFPESADNPQDVKAAETADGALRYYEQENPIHQQQVDEALAMWNDGMYGAYTRYAVDGDRFGFHDEPIMQQMPTKLGEDMAQCPQCQTMTPASQSLGVCATCGAQESIVPAPTVMRPMQAGVRRVPNGQECVDIVGGLELSLPFLAREQWQFPFLGWTVEVDKGQIRARFPDLENKILGSGQDSDDTFERRARLQLLSGLAPGGQQILPGDDADYVTYKRVWFRPWAFYSIDDEEQRGQLLQLFPDGCYVSFANNVFCEARPESMDEHWTLCQAVPVEGQAAIGIGWSAIAPQKIYNDMVNIERDVAEFTLPPTFVDPQVIDVEKWQRSRVQAGGMYNAKAPTGGKLQDGFFSPSVGQLSAQAIGLREEMGGEIMQHLTGVLPASYGGDVGSNDTAHGIAIERDQAMGQIGLWWGRMKEEHTRRAPLIVKAFMKRLDPVRVTSETDGGRFKDVMVDPNDLKVGAFRMKAEAAEDYPTTWPQRAAALTRVLESPAGQAVLMDPKNYSEIKRTLGVNDIEFPGEAGWKMQANEVETMAQGQGPQRPMPGMPPPVGPDGMPLPPQSTVPVNPLLDDHQAHLAYIKSWWQSDAREELQKTNPAAVMDVELHAAAHDAVLQQQAAMAAMMQAGPQPGQGKPAAGGGPPPQKQNEQQQGRSLPPIQ